MTSNSTHVAVIDQHSFAWLNAICCWWVPCFPCPCTKSWALAASISCLSRVATVSMTVQATSLKLDGTFNACAPVVPPWPHTLSSFGNSHLLSAAHPAIPRISLTSPPKHGSGLLLSRVYAWPSELCLENRTCTVYVNIATSREMSRSMTSAALRNSRHSGDFLPRGPLLMTITPVSLCMHEFPPAL